jgi:UDP-N-acetylglucosamine 4-epimerase
MVGSSKIEESTFLVTGGAGFIGSNLVSALLSHAAKKVRVLDNFSTGYKKNLSEFLHHPAFELIEGDIRDLKTCKVACEGIDFVSHQAALGSVPRSISDPITTNEVNITGFLNILVAAKDAEVKRIVYAASSSTYGDSQSLPKVESIIGNPLSPYAVTKYVNELYAHVFALNYRLESIGLRYFNVFGPKQDPNGVYAAVIPLFIQAVLHGKSPFINGDGLQSRDFTYITNVIQANLKAMMTTNDVAVNQIYNIGVGDRTTIKQMFETIKKIAGKNINPSFRNDRLGDVRDSLADISKAKSLLDYSPNVRLEEGLLKTFQWFSKNQNLI